MHVLSSGIAKSALAWTLCFFSLTTIFTTVHAQEPAGRQFSKATIYYYGWDVLTRTRLSADNVRKGYRTKIDIRNAGEVADLVRWLRLKELQAVEGTPEDARLVIDLVEPGGRRTTYYASRSNLLSGDSKKSRKIDDNFRNKFRFAAE